MLRTNAKGNPQTFKGMIQEISYRENINVKLYLDDGSERFINYAGYLIHPDTFMTFLGDMEKKAYPKLITSIEVDGVKIISF